MRQQPRTQPTQAFRVHAWRTQPTLLRTMPGLGLRSRKPETRDASSMRGVPTQNPTWNSERGGRTAPLIYALDLSVRVFLRRHREADRREYLLGSLLGPVEQASRAVGSTCRIPRR